MSVRVQLSAVRALTVFWLSLFAIVLLRTAWVSDDAYFTLRTIDNFVNGYGLRWNAAERVQAYTHPLWMLLVVPFYAMTHEAFFTSIAISIALTLATVLLLLRRAPSAWTAAVGLTILFGSRAFIDFSTSGLENPLTNLLLVLFFTSTLTPTRRPFVESLLAALLLLNRLDLLVLVIPALLVRLWPDRRRWRGIALGFLPLLAWELFSLVYYGFLVPNTAYAKLRTGIAQSELVRQGLTYLADSIGRDPITLLTIVGTTAWAFVSGTRVTRAIGAGIAVYLTGLVWAGGDFMSGRMLVAPLVSAVVVLIASDVAFLVEPRWALVAVAAALTTLARPMDPARAIDANGIADERAYYFASNGLASYARTVPFWPHHRWTEGGLAARREDRKVFVHCCNGMLGYAAGPGVHVIDTFALGDPLLARLPANPRWRVGHYERPVPLGYIETIASGVNQIRAVNVAAYYNQLQLVTRGPLWNGRRLKTIVRMHLGRYDALLDASTPSAVGCAFALLRMTQRAPVEGGAFSATAEALTASSCAWNARSSEPWIRLTRASSGAGPAPATIDYDVAPNADPAPRTGTIVLSWPDGEATLTVTQESPAPCTFTLAPSAQSIEATGRSASVSVNTSNPGCEWTASADVPWIGVTDGASNTGHGIVLYAVRASDSRTPRVGTLIVTGVRSGSAMLTVTQRAIE